MKVTKMDAFTKSERQRNLVPGTVFAQSDNFTGQSGFLKSGIGKLFSELKTDDYILIAIIAVLFFEGCDDYILLAALGYLFFMGLKD